jgi:hypothetical protein
MNSTEKVKKTAIWLFIIVLVVMFLSEKTGLKEALFPTPEMNLRVAIQAQKEEVAKQIEIERKKPKITALTLEPGKTTTVDVRGKIWVVDCHTDGEFTYSLVYQNQTVKTGRLKNLNGRKTWDRMDSDAFPVDSVILEKDSGGPLTIMLTLTEKD